ncbi:MAG TPA: hypothetical protein VHR43_11590 [Gemmatimonadales bacterium]|nr:hypothetical protein [Gemmatimonadales bacterium]
MTAAAPTDAPAGARREPAWSARPTRREARLRAEFAGWYPGLRAGAWESAAVMADRVLAQSLLSHRGSGIRGRVLLDAHFEFRHGAGSGGERHGVRGGGWAAPEG